MACFQIIKTAGSAHFQGDPFDNDASFYLALERYGYDVTDGRKAVEAFQRRWRPERIDGEIDGEVRAIVRKERALAKFGGSWVIQRFCQGSIVCRKNTYFLRYQQREIKDKLIQCLLLIFIGSDL